MRAIIAVAALSLAACGAGGGSTSGSPPQTARTPSTSTTVTGGPGGAPASTPTATASASPATAAPAATSSGSPVRATLAEPCRGRGQTQTLTMTGLKAGEVTGYSTQYSDGSNELTNKEYTGGYGSGIAGPDGRYATTWAVPQAAPAGRADVLVIWGSGSQPLRVSFTIPAQGQAC